MNDTVQIVVICLLLLVLTSIIGSSNIESSIFQVIPWSFGSGSGLVKVEKFVEDETTSSLTGIEREMSRRGLSNFNTQDLQNIQDPQGVQNIADEFINNDNFDNMVQNVANHEVLGGVLDSVVTAVQDAMPSPGPIMSNRIFYFRIGLANFFTRQDYVTRKSLLEFETWMKDKIYVWPNYQDICCKSLDKGDAELDCACDNINISNSSCLDTSMRFHNEPRLTTIEGNIGAAKNSNCTMTILGNDYMLVKRSLGMKIKEIKQVDIGMMKTFRLNITGQVALFALSRPMFLSFNTSGLYRVLHEDKNESSTESEYESPRFSNMFAHFDSTRTRDNIVYLKQVAHDEIEDMTVFQETNTHIARTFDPSKLSHPVTLYYLNYRSEVKVYDAQAHAFNFFVSQKIYNTSFRLSNTIEILTGNERSQEIKSVQLQKTPEGLLELRIDGNLYPLPEDFVYYDPTQYQRFDICFTISYDIVLIACYSIDSQTRKNTCYLTRYNLPRNFRIPKADLLERIKTQAPDMFYTMRNNLKDVMSVTSIPNYAHLAYSLGYVFNLS